MGELFSAAAELAAAIFGAERSRYGLALAFWQAANQPSAYNGWREG